MAGFLDWFFAFLTTMIDGIWMIFSGIFGGIFKIFNIVDYMSQFNSYKGGFGVIDWILAIFSFVLVIGIWGILIYLAILVVLFTLASLPQIIKEVKAKRKIAAQQETEQE